MKFEELLAEQLRDPGFRREWDKLDAPFQAGNLLIKLRADLNLTQAQLAEKAGLKRPYIARIENGDANPTIGSLARLLGALGFRLLLKAEDVEGRASPAPPRVKKERKEIPRSRVAAG